MGDPSNIDVSWRSALMLAAWTPAVLAAAFLLTREVERSATAWIAALIFAVASAMIPQIIGFAGAYDVWPRLTFAPFEITLLFGPLLYLHADRLMREGALGWRKWLLLPGAVQFGYYACAFLFLGDYKRKWAYNDAFHEPVILPIENVLAVGLAVWSIWAVLKLTRRYRAFLSETQSAVDMFQPVWVDRFIFILAPAALIYGGLGLAQSFIAPVSYVDAFPILVGVMATMAVLAMEALARLHAPFPKMPAGLQTHSAAESKPVKDWQTEGLAIRNAALDGGWHLEPRLSIGDLAARLASNETYVSRALNRGLGLSFADFVNGLRVETAKERLTNSDTSVPRIALESGFNSKATFNRAFKKATGQSPSDWRRTQASGAVAAEGTQSAPQNP